MPIQTKHGWECSICHAMYDRDVYALSCEKGHEVIYVAFHKDDLFNLIRFIYTGDDDALTPSLLDTLNKYRSGTV